jgi:hypothetical protein
MHLSCLFYKFPNKINNSFSFQNNTTNFNNVGISNTNLTISSPELSSFCTWPCILKSSPYLLKKANEAYISRASIEKKQLKYSEELSPNLTYYYLWIKVHNEPKPYDYLGLRFSPTAYPERLTFVVYYQIFFNLYYIHYKAIYLLTHFWKKFDFFSMASSNSRTLWLGDVWYNNEPLYLLQPLARLWPFNDVFHLFVRSVWFLLISEQLPNTHRHELVWKAYWSLRKVWILEMQMKRRILGNVLSRRKYFVKVLNLYAGNLFNNYRKEFSLRNQRATQMRRERNTRYFTKYSKQTNQLQLLSYMKQSPVWDTDTRLAKELWSLFNEADRLLKIEHQREDFILEESIRSEIMFTYRTLYFDNNFNRPRQTQWKNPFLSPKYKFKGDNFRPIKNNFTPLQTDPFWIHTNYGRRPVNHVLKKKKLIKHSFNYRLRLPNIPSAFNYKKYAKNRKK